MAGTLRINYTWSVQNPTTPATGQLPYTDGDSKQMSLTQTNVGGAGTYFSVPTTAGGTALPTTGASTFGYLFVTNLDVTNYVQFGPTSAGSIVVCGKLKPGESAMFRLDPGVTLRFLANTAAVKIEYQLLED